METTPKFREILSAYEESFRSAVDAIQGARRVSDAILAEDSTVEDLVRETERRVDAYINASSQVGGQLASALSDDDGGPDPKDANNRISGAIGADFFLAAQLLDATAAPTGDERSEALAMIDSLPGIAASDLDAEAGRTTEEFILAVRGEVVEGASAEPGDLHKRVDAASEGILTDGGRNVEKTLGTIVIPWAEARQLLERLAGSEFVGNLDKLIELWKRLKKKVLQLIKIAAKKLRDWIGAEKFDALVEKAKDFLDKVWDNVDGDNPAGKLMGIAFDSQGVLTAADKALSETSPEEAEARVQRIELVVKTHAKKVKFVSWGIAALAFLKGPMLGAVPVGPPAFYGIGLVIVLSSAWLVHDHIDALRFEQLPDRAVGVRRTAEGMLVR